MMSPLIVIDPVQKGRNAAAALSMEKFESFKKAAKEFLKSPSKEFFEKKSMNAVFLADKAKGSQLIKVKAKPLTGKIDVVGSKLLKIYEFLNAELKKHGFSIINAGWEWDKKNDACFYFLLDSKTLPKTVEVEGPPIKMWQHAENFKKVHRKTMVKNGKLYALEEREFTDPISALKSAARGRFVKERVKSVRIGTI